MLYMNEYEVHEMARLYYGHPILRPATQTLGALVDWTDRNSDGWAYWPKPCRAARALQELIGTTRVYLDDPDRKAVTLAELKRAYRPLRAFATRHGADFPIYLPDDVLAECVSCERVRPGAPGAGGAAHLCNECGG